MKKHIIVLAGIVFLMGICSSQVLAKENENDPATPFDVIKNVLDSFTLAPQGTAGDSNSGFTGYVSVWQRFLASNKDDLPLNVSGLVGGRAAEFATVGSSPGIGFGFKGAAGEKSWFDVEGVFLDKDEQFYFAGFDVGRVLRTQTTLNRFLHRLDHDPLTNVDPDPEAQEEFPFVDSNPDDVYSTARTEIINKTDFVIPSFPQFKIKTQVRYVHENGLQQARTFEMCTTCHIEAKTQGIDQRTRDFILGAELNLKGAVISYSHLGRRFDNGAAPVFHDYTNPYGSFIYEGTQEFAHIPNSGKRADTLKAKFDAVKNTSLFGSYTIAKIENKFNGGDADIKNFMSRLRFLIGKSFNVTLKYLNNKYDNNLDPNFVFDPENTLVANHLSKDGYTLGADASYRLPGRKIHLRASLNYNSMKRNFSFADAVEEEKVEITEKYMAERKMTNFRAGVTFYPSSKIRGFIRYSLRDVDNPLGVAKLPEENPVDPTSERFMTNLYTKINLLSAGLTLTPANRIAISANYFYNSGKNDTVNSGLDSSQKRNNFVLSLWYGVSNKISLTTAYTYLDEHIVNSLIYGTLYEYDGQRIAREDPNVPYDKKAHVFLFALNFHPSDSFSMFGDFSMTTGKSFWESSVVVGEQSTEALSDFSDQDLSHFRVSAGASYSLASNMSLFGKWKYEDFKDRAFLIHGEAPGYLDSGRYHILYGGLSYRF